MATTIWHIVASATFLLHITGNVQIVQGAQYLGKFLGKLSELHHGVSGEVYAVDGRTLHIKDFTYDGEGPAAYFFAGNSRNPSNTGFRIRDERGNPAVLRRYRREPVTITLPEGKHLNNIKWFSVWCEEFEVNFGDIKIPRNFDFPRPQKLEKLRGIHGVSSDNVVIVDAQTLLIPNFSYDGEAPDAKFWVGRGAKPTPQGIRIPDENGKVVPLRRYDRKTVVLTLPDDLTVFDIGHFGVWCEAFTVDFGHVQIPQNINVPPSLKMLGVSPQSKLNCEVLHDNLAFEIRWAVAGDSIVMQLVAKLEDREYMSFGVSGDNSRSVMVGGDVTVAWVDKNTLKGYAEDYFLDAKSQCAGPKGSCPDERLAERSNSIRLLNAAMVNGYSIVTYQRPLKAADILDRPIFTNQSQAIIWAIGPLNQRDEVSFHSQYTKEDQYIDFGRPPKWNCPMPESTQPSMKATPPMVQETLGSVAEAEVVAPTVEPTRNRNSERRKGDNNRGSNNNNNNNRGSQRRGTRPTTTEKPTTTTELATPKPAPQTNAWHIPPIQCFEPEDGVFYAQMGPTGGKHGYPAITGHVGWGISWYINGLLIPEINVVRGKTYTFVVEGGLDPEVPAKYHPFYITDDPIGGYEYKTEEERKQVTIFAGVKEQREGGVKPTGVGRLCHWTHQGDTEADDFESFGAYQRTLELRCDEGEPGVVQWTPDKNTPDTVYYQCFTHRYLGWKINVLDSCDQTPEGSAPEPVLLLPAEQDSPAEDLNSSPSLYVENRVKYNDLTTMNDIKKIVKPKLKTQHVEDQEAHNIFGPPILVDSIAMYEQPDVNSGPVFYAAAPSIVVDPYANNNFKASPLDGTKSNEFGLKESVKETTNRPPTTITILESVDSVTPKKIEVLDKTPNTLPIRPVPLPTLKIPQQHHQQQQQQQKPMYGGNKLVLRRPIPQHIQSRPPFAATPYMSANNRQVPTNMQHQQQHIFKKPVYRPMMTNKRPILMGNRPVMVPVLMGPKPKYPQMQMQMQMQHQLRPQNVVILKPQHVAQSKEQHVSLPQLAVQVSPQQASTEKEPETQKKTFATLLSVKPNYDAYTTMKPAINTGFHPDSVVIEGGFQPILSKEIEERMSEGNDSGPELEYESEIGVINVNAGADQSDEEKPIQSFGPMFIPSPLDNQQPIVKNATQKYPKRTPSYKGKPQILRIIKHGRSNAEAEPMVVQDDEAEDEIAMAAEKVESFYLPPNEGRSLNLGSVDSDAVPPGRVVTYDGRTVSGASLSGPVLDTSKFESRGSKNSEFLRARPQFTPFLGELPPLNPQPNNGQNIPQLMSRGSLHRDLETPTGSTKLSPVGRRGNRERRSAHHTDEHTAQQEAEKQQQGHHDHSDHDHSGHDHSGHDHSHHDSSGTGQVLCPRLSVLLSVVFLCLSKYL